MTQLTGADASGPRAPWAWRGSHAQRATLLALALATIGAFVADRWYGAQLEERARIEVRAAAAIRGEALVRASRREAGRLAAIASFTASRSSRAQLDAEFRTFVDGVLSGRGSRALQLIEGGRVVASWPQDPAGTLEDAAAPGDETLIGPVKLPQGGLALIVRQRLVPRRGFPDAAAIVLDVDDLVSSAGIPDSSSRMVFELYDRAGAWFGGDPLGSAVAPETLTVIDNDGEFRMLAAPRKGWAASGARWRYSVRGVLFLSVIALALLAWLLGRQRDDLEAEVRRSGTALELVMRTGRMGGWEEDLATHRVTWNENIDAIIGRPPDSAEAGVDRLAAAIDPADRPRLAAALARARGPDAAGFLEEVRVKASGGEPRWVLVLGDVARDRAGRPMRIVGVVADATERHALQARLRHAQRLEALGKLAGGVAHDFNNLLTAIGAFGELALARAADLPPAAAPVVQADLEQVIASARRGAALTQQLLTFSRSREGIRAPVDLGAAIRELLPTLGQLCANGVRIDPVLAPALPLVSVDAGQFAQVLTNLVVNAADAMPSGGTVQVRTALVTDDAAPRPAGSAPARWVLVEVADEGTGMSAEVRERIFEPYYTTKPMGRGTGLGLAVVYGIVESAGGTIAVHSVEGEGTTFRVLFPPFARSA